MYFCVYLSDNPPLGGIRRRVINNSQAGISTMDIARKLRGLSLASILHPSPFLQRINNNQHGESCPSYPQREAE
jgi:hypothetical protein